ncbi:MAG: GDSL-type esterase/lipase family protein [Longicatena sp.]
MMLKYKVVGIILASALVLFIIQLFPFSLYVNSSSVDKGIEVLDTLAKRDQQAIEQEIQRVRSQQKVVDLPSLANRFSSSLIMGDSLCEAFLDYNLLNPSNVIALRGKRADNIDQEIQKAIGLTPQNIFLGYGMNDIEYWRGLPEQFIEHYKVQIDKLQKALPNTKIYINSLIPSTPNAVRDIPVYKEYKNYNAALVKMCNEENITFIDNTKIVDFNKDEIYEMDGVHPKYAYYPIWLAHMASVAKL